MKRPARGLRFLIPRLLNLRLLRSWSMAAIVLTPLLMIILREAS